MPKTQDEVSLYRKYRPAKFSDVIGQDHIVSVVEASIKSGKIAHAYLLTGSRGTGKTTIARIIARELGTTDNDLYEMDAASNRGIDNIRELREAVRSMPFDSKYKVYIIDEVHMLTKEAFNALLKTLEEPPAHVVFILATTDLEKVPETIVSRCQTFVFKKPTDAILKKLATDIAKKEGYKLDQGAAELIALLGDGSFRDTHGILQKILSYTSEKNVSVEEVEKVTGAPSRALVHEVIESFANTDIDKGLLAIKKATEQNVDMRVFLKLILHLFRVILLARVAPAMKKEMSEMLSETDQAFLAHILTSNSKALSSKTLGLLLEAYQQTRYAFITELPLELVLVKVLKEVE